MALAGASANFRDDPWPTRPAVLLKFFSESNHPATVQNAKQAEEARQKGAIIYFWVTFTCECATVVLEGRDPETYNVIQANSPALKAVAASTEHSMSHLCVYSGSYSPWPFVTWGGGEWRFKACTRGVQSPHHMCTQTRPAFF